MNNQETYTKVFADVVTAMEQGNAPWIRPFSGGGGLPYNAVSKRPYSGGNVIALWAKAMTQGWKTLGFVTFRQALAAECVVRKGEKGSTVYFMNTLTVKSKEAKEEEDTIFFAKAFTVFNVDQLDELTPGALVRLKGEEAVERSMFEKLESCEEMVAATGADIRENDMGRAYYSPNEDFISIPNVSSFIGRDAYYGTLFHELGHWTGHQSRLNRELKNHFGEPAYAFEELVAELTASFLCARHGIMMVSQAAAYMKGWVKACKDHPETLARASSLAQRAADYIANEQPSPQEAM